MIYLLIGYVYLCIHRPFEIWPALGDLRIELIYFTVLTLAWCLAGKQFRGWALLVGIAAMACAFYFSWLCSPWADKAEEVVKNYTLVVLFGLMIATCVRDERSLYLLVTAFLVVLAFYMLHSIWEYKNGRHTFRMGIARMVGVDKSLGDPNSFGASIVYSLPFLSFFWHYWQSKWRRAAIALYLLMSIGCILLTGSRSSLLGVGVWGLLLVMQTRHKIVILAGLSVLAIGSWFVLPESLQNRFETIIDPSVGPANAQESGQGRIEGFFIGMKLWSDFPVTGVGPAAWRPASGSPIESHNLYGQVVGELGTVGLMAFLFLAGALLWNSRRLRRLTHPERGEVPNRNLYNLAGAITASTLLLFCMGMFGHNLLRYNWAWYCAFTAVGLGICRDRLNASEHEESWAYSTLPAVA
jgi:O-antigen ligase